MIKKIIIALIVSTLLIGCNSSTTTANQGSEPVVTTTAQATTEPTTEAATKQVVEQKNSLIDDGKYKVELGTVRKVTSDNEEGDLLEVTFTFANNSNEETSADSALYVRAYQDGIEMDQAFDVAITGENFSKSIKPGISIECKILYKLTSNSDVVVDVTEFLATDDSKVVKTYTLE